MIVKKARGHGGQKCWYDRKISKHGERVRYYHAIALSRMVSRDGSCWRLIIGPWALAFRFRGRKGGQA